MAHKHTIFVRVYIIEVATVSPTDEVNCVPKIACNETTTIQLMNNRLSQEMNSKTVKFADTTKYLRMSKPKMKYSTIS